jgi:Carboxypeptidase regulatory-like domain
MHPHDWTRFSRTAMAVAVAVVASAPALAQNTTASMGGRITGADGKPVAGATVSIVHVESGSTNTATTDAEGRYNARGLRAGGPYNVTISKGGLTEKRSDVFVQLAETLALDASLGAPTETIVVTGRGGADKFNNSSMGAGTNLGARELNAYASIQRNLQDYARTDPRLAQTDKERGEISAAGQNTRYNSLTIDGVTISDTFGLEGNNLPTVKQPISIDAIQAVQVNLSNYDVSQKGYTGANINAVTKSGTNDFKGSVYYVFRDDSVVGKRFNRTTGTYFDAPTFKEDTKGITFGGPIIKDTLFFFASYEQFKSSRTSPDFGPVGAPQTNVGISASALTSAIDISRNTWSFDAGTAEVPQGLALKSTDTLLKLDWNISEEHRASIRYNKTDQTEPIFAGFSPTGLSLSSNWWNQEKAIESVVAQWFADWTPNFSTELKVSKRDYRSDPKIVTGNRLPQVTLRFAGALPTDAAAGTNSNPRDLTFGTERSRHLNSLATETLDVYLGGTLVLGAHELKFGADYADNDVFNAFLQDINGQYRFQCENSSAAITYSFGAINCTTATAAQVQAAVLENYRLGRPSFYQVQAPRTGRVIGDGVANWSYGNTGLFLQDTWKVTPEFGLTFGVRLDQQNVPSVPIANAAAAAAPVAGTTSAPGVVTTRASGGFGYDNTVTLDGNNLAQPRIGFNWNLGTKEQRMQLRGGVGLFQGAAANVWLSNPFSNTGAAVAVLSCASFTACSTANGGGALRFSANADGQPTPTGNPPAANVDFLSPDLQQPSVWKANLGFEVELPTLPVVGGLVASAEWLHTKTNSGLYYRNLNLGNATRKGTDGRDLFYRAEGYVGGTGAAFTGACWNADGSPITTLACATPTGQSRTRALSNPNFANVLLAEKTKQGGGDAVTVSIGRPTFDGWGWNLAYTRTVAKDVSPLTSSTSLSNWGNRNIFNPNEEVLANSNYLVKDRISANFNWSAALVGKYRSSVGVFYEGRRGKPYSWTYLNDLNGDGQGGNDLMYIPTAPGSGEVVFRGRNATETSAQAETAFWEIVDANPGLSSAKGGIVGRNNNFAPWVNNVDVRFSQELPGFMSDHKVSLTFDILNFGNLLNKKWGRIDEIGFPSNRSFVNYNGLDSNGKYIYSVGALEDFRTLQNGGESQWALQLTLRYSF